jgi:flagellar hook-length control protein FliK
LAKIQQWVAVVAESPVTSSRPADTTARPNNSLVGTVADGVQVASKESTTVLVAEPVLMKGVASLPMNESKSATDQTAKPVAAGKSGDSSPTETSAKGKVPIPAVPSAFRPDLQHSEKQPETNLLAKAIATAEIRSGEGKGYQTDSNSEGIAGNPVERTVVPGAKPVPQQQIEPEVSVSAKDAATNASLKASYSPTGSDITPSMERGFQALTGKPAPKTQPLMGQAEGGSGVNPMSRTLPVGAADHSLLERSASASPSQFWSQVEKANVVAQLIEKAQLVANSKNSEIVISLKPEFLGRLSLHAAIQDGALMATITAESPAVKTLLESHIPVLQQALQEQGLSVSKISVVQGNELSFSGFHPGSSHPQQNFEPQSAPQMPWLDSTTALEPEPEEIELPMGSVRMPNQSLHLFA